MNRDYYTVEQISDMLDIHPKTVQRYIREGRLRATKIGKSWRVTGHDLSAFVEHAGNEGLGSENRSARSVIASSVIDIGVDRKEDAIRIMNTLTAALNAKPPEYDSHPCSHNIWSVKIWSASRSGAQSALWR